MKKSISLLTLLFIAMLSFAQTPSETIKIKKKHGKIINVDTQEKLSKDDLKLLLDEESYDYYIRGRKQRNISNHFWANSAACAASSIALFTVANIIQNDCVNNHVHNYEGGDIFCDNGAAVITFWLMGGVMAVGTIIDAIPATVLTICSNKNINNAVDGYNQKTSDVTLGLGATNNGIGLTLKF